MGLFGKFLIEVTCTNGEVGYYMRVFEGKIFLSSNVNNAEHYMTLGGARSVAAKIDWSQPALGDKGFSYVDNVAILELR